MLFDSKYFMRWLVTLRRAPVGWNSRTTGLKQSHQPKAGVSTYRAPMEEPGKKEKKVAPPPPASISTAALLIQAAASKVLGLRPGRCGGDLQPTWTADPGTGKITLSLEVYARDPFSQEGALLARWRLVPAPSCGSTHPFFTCRYFLGCTCS